MCCYMSLTVWTDDLESLLSLSDLLMLIVFRTSLFEKGKRLQSRYPASRWWSSLLVELPSWQDWKSPRSKQCTHHPYQPQLSESPRKIYLQRYECSRSYADVSSKRQHGTMAVDGQKPRGQSVDMMNIALPWDPKTHEKMEAFKPLKL